MNVFHLPGICAQVVIDHWLYISWSRPMKKPLWGVNNGSNKIHRFVLVSSLDMLLITWLYKEWKLWGTLSVNVVSHWNLIINSNIFDLMDRWGPLECIITFSLSRYILSVLTRSLHLWALSFNVLSTRTEIHGCQVNIIIIYSVGLS